MRAAGVVRSGSTGVERCFAPAAVVRPGRAKAWLVPDLALTAACVTIFYSLFLFQGYTRLFRDSDAGWHIRAGEAMLATGELPRTDPYSFTRQGAPWFAWEWGADVLAGAAHRAAGLSGVAMLYALAIGAGVWLWFRLHWSVGGNFLLACAMAPPLLTTCNIHWLARPHVLSWVFLLAAMLCAETTRFRRRDLAWAAAGTALWANVHATFFFAPLIAFVYAAGHLLRPLVWNLDRRAEWRRARWFALAAAAAAPATLLNPYGWNLHRHVWTYLADSDLLARIGEFQSFNFHSPGSGQILLCLGIAALGGACALAEKRLAHFFLAVMLLAAALQSARALPLVALMLLPLAGGAITAALGKLRGLTPAVRSRVDAFLAYSRRLRELDARNLGLMWAPVAALAFFALLRTPGIVSRTGFPPDQFPVAAAAELEKLPEQIRLLAPDKFGGYLIYRFAGRRKVFFDGRSDLYGAGFLKDYARLVEVRPGWRELMARYGFTHALLPNDYSLVPALEADGWRQVWRDPAATLLARPELQARIGVYQRLPSLRTTWTDAGF